jgi:hypothetical protein
MKAIKKAQTGYTIIKNKAKEVTPDFTTYLNDRQKARVERIKKNNPARAKKVQNRMIGRSDAPLAKNGKWMQKAAASIKKRGTAGKCTPITKPGCTGKAKTLAKTFKKIAKSNKKK